MANVTIHVAGSVIGGTANVWKRNERADKKGTEDCLVLSQFTYEN
jgi:hypothetical protein